MVQKWRLNINNSKTEIVHYRHKSKARSNFNFTYETSTLEYADKYKYLGVWLHEHLDMSVTVEEVSKSATRALGKVISVFKASGGSSHEVFTKLFDTAVLPVILYSAGIWGLRDFSKLNKVLNRAGRFFLGLPPKAPNLAVHGEMGWYSIGYHSKLQVVRLYSRLLQMDNNRFTKKVFDWSSQCKGHTWIKGVKKFLNNHNLEQIEHMSSREAIQHCSPILQDYEKQKWHENLWKDNGLQHGKKLRTYRKFKKSLSPEAYLNINIPKCQRAAYVKFRCGVLPLAIETGRYQDIPLESRICRVCNRNEVEDEEHFLLDCPLYLDLRKDSFDKANKINNSFTQLCNVEKLDFLMNNSEMSLFMVKTIDKMFSRRKLFVKR